ncbi:MAG: M20/M25/M40 family metallo-hydrolase [Acidimicrobiaceae bacterium]|nr:M20/M25/M40 family metallo-hydrolase [Acidimicrobiaceae bacterium]
MTDFATWLSRLVRIPSVNPLQAGPTSGVPGEAALATELAACFRSLGADRVELEPLVDGRPNVYAVVRGRTDRVVALDVHTDTVTVENMTDPPFDGRVEHGAVWGRGALDTKASLGVICALLEDWQRTGLRPDPTLVVVGSIGEEAGGMPGAIGFRAWAERQGMEIDQLVIAEPTELRPVVGHKGGLAVRITVHGRSAHSATPDEGANAIYAAARVVSALEAHHHDLTAVPPATPVGTGTLTVSIIHGGVASNIVPELCTVSLGRRLAPGEDPAVEFERIAAIARDASPLPVTVEHQVAGETGMPAFYAEPAGLAGALAAAAGTTPTTAPFGTNALRYDGFAREKVVFGPGRIEDAHKPTEHVTLADLDRTAAALTAWLQPG